jgi:hypothetical protein
MAALKMKLHGFTVVDEDGNEQRYEVDDDNVATPVDASDDGEDTADV